MEKNNNFWIYLGLGVVAAVGFKWWATPESILPTKRWSISANMDDEIQFKRNNRAEKIAGLSASRRTTEQVEVKSGTTVAAAAPALKAQQKVAKLENKAKKKDKKKKKKAKVIAVPTSTESVKNEKKNSDVLPVGGAGSPNFVGGNGIGGNPLNPATQSDWEKLLLTVPDHHQTVRFISLYQSRQIASQVFYAIVTEMLADERVQMRQLGVMSLGATPSLKSYEMLVAVAENDSTGPVKTQAQSYLDDSYNRPQTINVLYAALTEKDVSTPTQLQALRNLYAVITKSRAPSSQTEGTPDTPAAKNQIITQQIVLQYFKQLEGVLTKLSESASEEQIRALAQKDLGEIKLALETPAAVDTQVAGMQTPQ